MAHGGRVPKRQAVLAAAAGSAVLAAYSVAGALQTLVWNPLAAVPGATLEEIHRTLEAAGESLGTSAVLAWSAVGIALAAGGLVGTARAREPRGGRVIIGYLVLLVLAAPTHWFVAFTGGLGIADAFAISGGDHAPWGGLLYLTSLLALLGLVGTAMWHRRLPGA